MCNHWQQIHCPYKKVTLMLHLLIATNLIKPQWHHKQFSFIAPWSASSPSFRLFWSHYYVINQHERLWVVWRRSIKAFLTDANLSHPYPKATLAVRCLKRTGVRRNWSCKTITESRQRILKFSIISQDMSFIGFVSRQGSFDSVQERIVPREPCPLAPTGDSLCVKSTSMNSNWIAHEMLLAIFLCAC